MKIFISYAREDIEIAKKLYHDLKKAGINPWMDKHDLLPGQNWRVLIPKTIEESKYFLAILSSHSLSKKGFVQKELKKALDILEEFPSAEDIFIIPIRIEDCKPEDEKLKYLHWADLFPSYEKGLQDILRVLSQNRQNRNIPESPQIREDIPEKKEVVRDEDQPLKTEPSEEKPLPESENKRSISAGDAEKSVLVSGDGNVINIIHQNDPITGDNRRQQLLSQLAAGKITLEALTAEWNKLNVETPVPRVKSVSPPQAKPPKYNLRNKPMTISNEEAQYKFRLDKNWRPLEYVKIDFKDNGDGTITDHATGLMWQKSGSDNYMYLKDVPTYIEKLNRKKYAEYSDWRLPTVDELKSLLTPKEMNGDLYIDPIFDKTQLWCWASDKRASGGAWHVNFNNGSVYWGYINYYNYVRSVRSIQ